jgi:Mg2+/citrate symporter
MGEVMPVIIAGFVVLIIIAIVMAKSQLNKKAVVKPLDQEDMVERVKIHLTGELAKSLAAKLVAANEEAYREKRMVLVDIYEPGMDRLIRFEVDKGEKSESA